MLKSKKGWYRLLNPSKFVRPIDEYMGSFRDGEVQYKSSLELIAFRYADYNKHVKSWSVEPFPIQYVKPTDGKQHRYYVDLYLEFANGKKFIVEIKPKSETTPPKKPKPPLKSKNITRYQVAMQTWMINQAKWNSARLFASKNGLEFIILTENELKGKKTSQ